MRQKFRSNGNLALLSLTAIWLLSALPAISQETPDDAYFPDENFVQIYPTLPNSKLNFDDDSHESCCAKDYNASGQPTRSGATAMGSGMGAGYTKASMARSEFERANPRYLENSTPAFLVTCERFAEMAELASNGFPSADWDAGSSRYTLPIESYSTNVSLRQLAWYATDPTKRVTSDFHIETAGGSSQLQLRDVNSYSVCMARGNNVAMVANTDSGSILTYNGSDHIYLSGNNTNMLTRTGGGEDLIELHQARPTSGQPGEAYSPSTTWTAYNIYKTAISGGTGTDTLAIRGTPYGAKWCHLGGYRAYGEYFYVVELALPPTVTEGPRRQRINIGESVEFVVIKGKKYRLNDFLVHGAPVDAVARSVPIGDALPRVAISR